MTKIIFNIFGLIAEIQKLKANVTGKLFFDKYKDSSTQKYKKKLAPNITFQPNKTFLRNNLYEKKVKVVKQLIQHF